MKTIVTMSLIFMIIHCVSPVPTQTSTTFSTTTTNILYDPIIAIVVEMKPAPGQFVNSPSYSNPGKAITGPSQSSKLSMPDNSDLISLGGFGGYIIFKAEPPLPNGVGYDFIVFGNAFYPAANPLNRYAEPAYIEVMTDSNSNNLPDDTWYLLNTSHLQDATLISKHYDRNDASYDPMNKSYYPTTPYWTAYPDHIVVNAYLQPDEICASAIIASSDATTERIWGYADLTPTDGTDNLPLYLNPDNPFEVGFQNASRGGDPFDLSWAVDASFNTVPVTSIDFIRITNGCDSPVIGEKSPEIDVLLRLD